MRVAVVGPTHPYKGGVAAHTTELARRLAAAGHECDLVSWSHLYPARLYPGEQAVPGGVPDLPPYPRTTRRLSWARPDSWVSAGRRLRAHDLVVLVHVIPAVVPAHLVLLQALGRSSWRRPPGAGRTAGSPRVVVLAHNVLPHEMHPGATALVRAMLGRAEGTLVHSGEQGRLARGLGARDVAVVPLPPHLPGGPALFRAPYDGPPRLLVLGMVRPYKGTDLLLEALAQVPGLTLTIAGELWGRAGEQVRALAQTPALRGRVTVHGGYVPAPAIAGLMAGHDVLALPYRSATASQNAALGHSYGLPVLATRVGAFARDVTDGVDGLLADPGSVGSLVDALRRLSEPGALRRLRDGVRPPDLDPPWAHYLTALAGLGQGAHVLAPGQLDPVPASIPRRGP